MQLFTIQVVQYRQEYAYFQDVSDAERYMDIAMDIERGVFDKWDWDICCSMTPEMVEAESWPKALAQLQLQRLEEGSI